MAYRVNPPYHYFTQDLANDKVRLFALEEIWDDEVENDLYENLRAVATLACDDGGDLCDFLNDLMDDIDEEAMHVEGKPTRHPGRQALAARQWGEARAQAVKRLMLRGKSWPNLEQLISFVPTAVATAVHAELARQGLDVSGMVKSRSGASTKRRSEQAEK